MSLQGLKRRFSDFPLGEWIPAAGKCGGFDDEDDLGCEENIEVKIFNPGNENAAWMDVRCRRGHSRSEIVGWTVRDEPVILRAGKFYPLLGRAEHAYCAICGRIIVEVPLILWGPNAPDKVEWELDFCFGCVEKLKLMGMFAREKSA